MHLYLHIPFCRQACYYCDFHFSTNTARRKEMTEAMVKEMTMQAGYLSGKPLSTLYLGGGTPSLLSEGELGLLMEAAARVFGLEADAEITVEANPDDLDAGKVASLIRLGVNRLSIGVQSFHQPHLEAMHRAHTAAEAEEAVKRAQDTGFSNISADLIYAIPAEGHAILLRDISRLAALDIPHISAYCLTIEPGTVYGKRLKEKKMAPIDDAYAAEQFELTVQGLADAGYEQYEISNFARHERYSRHNTAYWQRKSYLGIGPSAHSYNGVSRQFNVAGNGRYLTAIAADKLPATVEILTQADQVNEYLLTGLRTRWGCNLELLDRLSDGTFRERNRGNVKEMVARGWLHVLEDRLLLTEAGKLFADRVASELFV